MLKQRSLGRNSLTGCQQLLYKEKSKEASSFLESLCTFKCITLSAEQAGHTTVILDCQRWHVDADLASIITTFETLESFFRFVLTKTLLQ